MDILLTGFDAFGDEKINPASLVLEKIPKIIGDAKIHKLIIPTVFGKSASLIEEKIEEIRPDIIISLGQAGGRSHITVERVAINIDDASIDDNEGNRPIDRIIREDGEPAYFATIPIKAIINKLQESNIPASISNTAGTYVCNHVMYQDLYLANKYKNIRAGFIHLPFLPDQVVDKNGMASMDLQTMVAAIKIAIEISIDFEGKEDIKIGLGRTH
ncbi:pyroglutamyl-peptidase I [Anaerococcus sp. NML200574]|uniref:pyroglutamyl-peptidase I n=1 Tax=Anaerococcus sp. NML200574 TaxID=2954486 RepID=UPI002237BD7A|nr:pyroglutamyl-peptidase I [Anaerococcus sp. NML200574]MCW6679349.1 pyroglutamyl-peptidase I [Anaerococcus sp. NML200574]